MTTPDQPASALLDVVTLALVTHRVDREGPDFDHADASLLGYARAVTAAVQPLIEHGFAEGRRQATEAFAGAIDVLGYVSRGRRYVGVEPYPDAAARRILGALDDAGLLVDGEQS